MKAPANIDDATLQQMHQDMVRIRAVEEAIAARYSEQEMRCPVHLSIGQEAAAVGICSSLRKSDKVYSTHRCHAHYLAKGGKLAPMLAEIYGKAAGCLGGRGGSMHLADPDQGMFVSVPIVASSIPLAVGGALAERQRGGDGVTVAFVGDASLEEGVFHEAANFAALRNLPVLFACENNYFSVYSHLDKRQPDRPLGDLARAHKIPVIEADGNDVCDVYRAASDAVALARAGKGPSFVLMPTYRWREHCGPNFDDHLGYRDAAEFAAWKARDPLEISRKALDAQGGYDAAAQAAFAARLSDEIEAAFRFAKEAPLPDPATARLHVYA
ncbi:MAG: thiamine pyrophosphate-dependent dehydrogenase E1 component subunit alpha [Proteobacteria bacterium]|nr:thiamine pyrophosphate-dependent dehydrogenase E1 component subunit alpha [Pseudomonadota bacterium]